MATRWFVEIVERGGDRKVEWRSKPVDNESTAERMQRGARINLNHEKYRTQIVRETQCLTESTEPPDIAAERELEGEHYRERT